MGPLIILLASLQLPTMSTDTLRVEALAAYLPRRPAHSITEVMPSRWVELITEANKIESFLLCPNWRGASEPCPDGASAMYFNPYAIRENGDVLSDVEQATLKRIVLEPRNYSVPQSLGDTKGCVTNFNIGYLMTVTSERSESVERIVLAICHSCSVISIRLRGSNITLDIDYARDEILELTRAMFPDDAIVERLYQRLRDDAQPGK